MPLPRFPESGLGEHRICRYNATAATAISPLSTFGDGSIGEDPVMKTSLNLGEIAGGLGGW